MTGINSNKVYIHDFVTKQWKVMEPNISVPKVDSHCSIVVDDKMYVYGGYISDEAEYLKDIYCFDLTNLTWSVTYKGGKEKEPKPRSNFSMVEDK